MPEELVCLDPGIGFGKTVAHNLELVRRLDELVAIGRPLLVGLLAQELARAGCAATRTRRSARRRRRSAPRSAAFDRGATILRVHDVREHVEALAVAKAVVEA